MSAWRWMILGAVGTALAMACSDPPRKSSDDDDGSGGVDGTTINAASSGTSTGVGGATTASSTGPGPGPNSSSSMVSSSTGGLDCSADPVNNDPVCTSCVQQSCCGPLKDCINAQLCNPLLTCAGQSCPDCFYPICDAMYMGSPIGYYFAQECANCNGANCCQQIKTCLADTVCADCLLNNIGCANTTLDDDVNACESNFCSVECN